MVWLTLYNKAMENYEIDEIKILILSIQREGK
jgi:hypothetical protein